MIKKTIILSIFLTILLMNTTSAWYNIQETKLKYEILERTGEVADFEMEITNETCNPYEEVKEIYDETTNKTHNTSNTRCCVH